MIELNFSDLDKYEQIHADVDLNYIQKSLDINSTVDIKIGEKELRYTFQYNDVGTVGYAGMEGSQAVGGRITNMSHDWSEKPTKKDYPVINFCGTINHKKQTMSLHFFMNCKNN